MDNVFRIDLPPLRERRADIDPLAAHFLQPRHLTLDPAALRQLQRYHWPGNVRELINVLERAAIMTRGSLIGPQQLPADLLADTTAGHAPAPAIALDTEVLPQLPQAVAALEKTLISAALEKTGGNKSRAAKLLGISERSLWYKLGSHGDANQNDETGRS